ncbi:hypothetical protein DW064_14235 [Segatella copri]|uniref:Uncharacterized protein n=1 Tax=Segatella copri TaxID=165179 RepID=A0AA92WJH4_9BACT|nr:hypothetical protein DW064_14235 [Segatella copri]
MGMLVASFRVPYRGMPIIACYQFQAAKLRFFPETTKYFFFFLRNILEKSELFIHKLFLNGWKSILFVLPLTPVLSPTP